MLIKKEFKEIYKFYTYICYFFNNLNKDNVVVTIKEDNIDLKIKNKPLHLVLHHDFNKNLEIKTSKKSKKMSLQELKNKNIHSNMDNFQLNKNFELNEDIENILYWLILLINNDFYDSHELNEIESHSLTMSPAEVQKHLKICHGKKIYDIGNSLKLKIIDETRSLMNSRTKFNGDIMNRDIYYYRTDYEILNFNYKDKSIIEDQFIKFERLFLGADFLTDLLKSLDNLVGNAMFEYLPNKNKLKLLINITYMSTLFILNQIVDDNLYSKLKKKFVFRQLEKEKNGKEYLINKTLHIINMLDNNKLNNMFFKDLSVIMNNCLMNKTDYESVQDLSKNYSHIKHMNGLIILTDIIDSMTLSFYIEPFISKNLNISINKDNLNVFTNPELKNGIIIRNKLFIRLDPEYNDGLYAILYDNTNDSMMILFESNKNHRMSVIISNVIYNDYINGFNNGLYISNINEGHYSDTLVDNDEFIEGFQQKIDSRLNNIRAMIISVNDESYFDSNETFNIICKNENKQMFLTYEKSNKFKVNFFNLF